jgi:hypothetical protein
MPTTTEYDTADPAFALANDPTAPADDAGLQQRRKGWVAGLLLQRSPLRPQPATPPALPPFYVRVLALPRRARRRLSRKFAAALVGAALLFASVQIPAAHAATITVDGVRCTLADAIRAANIDSAVGRCKAGSGADVIVLQKNVTLTAPVGDYYNSPTGLPLVTSEITIQGNGRTIRRVPSDPDQFRLLAINAYGNLTLNNVTLTGGHAQGNGGAVMNASGALTINNSTLSGNTAGQGGGIYSFHGDLQITDSALSDNAAHAGGAMNLFATAATIADSAFSGNTAAQSGGGLFILSGTQTITNSIVSGNSAGFAGGGISSISADLTINNSTLSGNSALLGGAFHQYGFESPATINDSVLSGNTAGFDGGGVFVGEFTTLTINRSTLSDNSAAQEGGAAYSYGWLTINDSTISGNIANEGGGVALVYSGVQEIHNSTFSDNIADNGGGLFVRYGGASVANSTFGGNSAGEGGGIYCAYYCDLTVENVTVSGNSAAQTGGGLHSAGPSGALTFERSLFSGNAAPAGREVYFNPDPTSLVKVNAFNLFGFSGNSGVVGFAPGPSDIVPTQPLARILAALADNGGPTQTHALVPGGPAIDAAPSADCAAPPVNGLDQRGFPRNVDGDGMPSSNECDVGAFELQLGD